MRESAKKGPHSLAPMVPTIPRPTVRLPENQKVPHNRTRFGKCTPTCGPIHSTTAFHSYLVLVLNHQSIAHTGGFSPLQESRQLPAKNLMQTAAADRGIDDWRFLIVDC